ncbi:hypothetical protein EZJ43_10965 [Pedobacter changchengzhani]|uniref:LiaF transmembrane domain-containing protein n=1 Tax=Pedobacter changchengzhani TaxID=2529274 RepID=A0A4R5MLA1_9SPHI|nr:LiaF domain-containing protein [Pedobacter changchengzhani]TDG35869.1 hypothetical protein EZJ43_10965 [Pedobacter changchengzhani]
MENIQNNNKRQVLRGLIILIVGLVFLLPAIGINVPNWVFGWYTFLLCLGFYIGVKRNFRGGAWLALIIIGALFTIDAIPGFDFDASKYGVGLGLVALGAFVIFKSKDGTRNRFKDRINQKFGSAGANYNTNGNADAGINDNAVIDVVAVFGGSQQTVYSKQFNGGSIIAVFGGADINFTQSDFADTVCLDVTAIFGGIKLIVPPGWAIKSNVTAVFGSVEDKRGHNMPNSDVPLKTLVLAGSAFFGGIEVKSF